MSLQERVEKVRKQLNHGDLSRIARIAGLSRQHVSNVFNPKKNYTDKHVLTIAESFLARREIRIKDNIERETAYLNR